MDKITIKNGNLLKQCVLDLFETLYQKNNNNYALTLTKMSEILCSPNDTFLQMRHKIIMYILAKAIEINHYRRSIDITNNSTLIVKALEQSSNGTITPANLRVCLNDALYYLTSTNRLFQQDAINNTIANGFNKKLYQVSPALLFEHMATLMEEPSEKELLLESVEEAMTIVYEKRMSQKNEHPTPKSKIEFMKSIRYPSAFHLEVVGNFQKRVDINTGEDDKKVLMCEMVYAMLSKKEATGMSFSYYNLFNKLRNCEKTKSELSRFYDEHNVEIIHCFTGSEDSFEKLKKDGILEEQKEFENAKVK